jgi:hypothetical protein
MSRVPDQQTMLAIAGALDARDRRSNRPAPLPPPVRRAALRPSEIAGALRGIGRDITSILSRPADLTSRELTLAALGGQLLALALQAEGEI